MPGAWESIATYTLPSDTADITRVSFTSLSNTYVNFMLLIQSRSKDATSGGDGWGFLYNKSGGSLMGGSTTRRSYWGPYGGDNVNATGVLAAPLFVGTYQTQPSYFYLNAAQDTTRHTVYGRGHVSYSGAGQMDRGELHNGDSGDSGAVTTISVYGYYERGIKAGSVLALYGLKAS